MSGLLLLIVFSAAASPQHSPTAVLTVDTIDPAAIPGDGSCSLIEAIDNANADADTSSGDCPAGQGPDTIELAASVVYTLTAVHNSTNGANGLPSIASTITISGNNSTIARSGTAGTPSFRLLHIAAGGSLTVFDMTFRNGHSDGFNGGGIRNQGGTLTMNNSVVRDNSTVDAEGGGIYNQDGSVTLYQSTVGYNSVVEESTNQDGGGLANKAINQNTTTILVGSQVISNTSDGDAGGLSNAAGSNITATVIISDSLVSHNVAQAVAGGIWNIQRFGSGNANMRIIIYRSEVSHNVAYNSPGFIGGGGLVNMGNTAVNNRSTILIEESSVSFNRAETGVAIGGGLVNDLGYITVTRSLVQGNEANSTSSDWDHRGGGAVGATDGTVTFINSTISGNTVSGNASGGAILSINFSGEEPSLVRLINSTVSENSADAQGGTVHQIDYTGSQPIVTEFENTILANNSSSDGFNCSADAVTLSMGHNLEDGDSCDLNQPTDQVNKDPLLGPFQNNGGPTATYALLDYSPAIDAGNDSTCSGSLVGGVDQRGIERPIGPSCDIGSYESDALPPLPPPYVYLPLMIGQP
jgi:hypothetical protein